MDASLCYCWAAKSLSRRGVRPFFWKSCPQENSGQGKAKKPRARAKPKTKPKTNIKTKPRARAGLVVHPRVVSVVSSAARLSQQRPTSTSSTATCI